MRLARIGPSGHEIPTVVVGDDAYIDVSETVNDFNEAFFASDGVTKLAQAVASGTLGQPESLNGRRLGAPISRPHQIICIGLNYEDHAAESNMPLPDEPVIFSKSPNTLVGPFDDVRVPPGATKTDWEVELGIVIGRRARYLASREEAESHIAGYVLSHDVSERAFQLERAGQWMKGKSCETFNPCGPWLVTPDEIPDVLDLNLWLAVNGVREQDGSTRDMIFEPAELVRYLSQFLVLEPGDLINTGTPAGVGFGQNPQRYLSIGDVVELGSPLLGLQRQRLIAHDSQSRGLT